MNSSFFSHSVLATLCITGSLLTSTPLFAQQSSSISNIANPSWNQIGNSQVDTPTNNDSNLNIPAGNTDAALTNKLLPKELISKPEEVVSKFQKENSEFLPPEKAFDLSYRVSTEEVVFTITPSTDYYVYRDKIYAQNSLLQNIQIPLPTGEWKKDPTFGQTQVFHKSVELRVPKEKIGNKEGSQIFSIHYQGCHIKGLCYNPITKFYEVNALALKEVAAPQTALPQPHLLAPENATFEQKNVLFLLLSFFVFGLLLSLTPCVLPMVPVLFSIISSYNQKNQHSWRTNFGLASLYVLGMALMYTIGGVIAALTGSLLSTALQNIWVLGTIAFIFVLLSLSMFGVYTFQVPQWVQNKLSQNSSRSASKAKIAVFFMGVVSSVILGPCVAAPMAGALLYIGQTKDVWLGGSALFVLALGMGMPLMLLSVGAQGILPKTGAWMKIVSILLGFLLLAMALYIVQPFMNRLVYFVLAALLSLGVGGFLFKAQDFLLLGLGKATRLTLQLVGICFFVYGVVLSIGAYQGATSIWQPLTTTSQAPNRLFSQKVHSLPELKKAVAESEKSYVLIDFYAAWCASCIEMDNYTFSQQSVQNALLDVEVIKVDITNNTAQSQELLKTFQLYGPPALIFVNPQFKQVLPTVLGFQNEKEFLATIGKLPSKP